MTHLLAMFFSCLYIFLHEWNYINWYTSTNPMDCGVWFEMIMFSITMSKIFTYSFLMLRSTLSFSSSFFKIPLKVSVSIVILSCVTQLIMMGLMISDYIPISPFPSNGFCFRILGENGVAGIAGFNFSDAISGFIAFIIFWYVLCLYLTTSIYTYILVITFQTQQKVESKAGSCYVWSIRKSKG